MSKIIAEDCRVISIYELRKKGVLIDYYSGIITWTSNWGEENKVSFNFNLSDRDNKYFELSYTITNRNTEEKTEIKQKYPISTTSCHYGGLRYWFECSAYNKGAYCGRRVAKLYLCSGSNYFACRHCYNLSYESRNLNQRQKPFGKIISIPELEKLEKDIKCEYYNGKMTKKYKRFLEKNRKSYLAFMTSIFYLSDRADKTPKRIKSVNK